MTMPDNGIALHSTPARHSAVMKAIARRLQHIEHGQLTLTLPKGETVTFGNGKPQAHLELHSYRPLSRLLLQGDMGFAESYLQGEWSCPDLTQLFDLALLNSDAFGLQHRGGWLYRSLNRLRHLLNSNTRRGSRRNIAYHYDLGNAFYQQWLDPSMTYSSALFDGDESLQQAQQNKYQAIADMAGLQPGNSVLEIGCGWGGFSELAASQYQSRIHGLTLSSEQLAYAQQRYRQAGIDHLASASLTDYRDVDGQYDKIVSIEMFEAVGYEHWDTYFQTLKRCLKPGGAAVLQIILIEDKRFENYRRQVDFIQRYIFPGGLLPSVEALHATAARNGMAIVEQQCFGDSYARTLNLWHKEFLNHWETIKPLGFDERFKRMWEYYLSYCEAGFNAGTIDVGMFKIVNAPA